MPPTPRVPLEPMAQAPKTLDSTGPIIQVNC